MGENKDYLSRGGLFQNYFFNTIAVILFSGYPYAHIHAGQWEFIPSLIISKSYDDNIFLRGTGEEEDDYVTQINPGISIQGKSKHVEANLTYFFENLYYQNNPDRDNTYHTGNADLKAELLQNLFYVNANLGYKQRNLDRLSAVAGDNVTLGGDRSDVKTYMINPYFRYDIGNTATINLQYITNDIDYKNDSLLQSDSTIKTKILDISSGEALRKLAWQLHYEKKHTEYASGQSELTTEDSYALIRYRFMSKSYLIAMSGYEENTYEVPVGVEQPKGSYWSAGLGWQPSRRTNMEVTKGERFYGETAELKFSHQTRRSVWNIQYSENILTSSELIELQPGTPRYGAEGELVGIYLGEPTLISQPLVILDKSLVATASWKTGRTSLGFRLLDSERVYQETQEKENIQGGSVSVRWRFMPKTYFMLTHEVTNSPIRGTDDENDIVRTQLGVEQKFSSRLQFYFNWDQTELTSADSINDYKRNLYTLSAHMSF